MVYQKIIKPLLFKFDAEMVHDATSVLGEWMGESEIVKQLLKSLFSFENPALSQTIGGVKFPNPIGLSAGFDYDGHLAGVMKPIGFGFNTVGTVTAKPYEGNPKPRLGRLPNSKSLLVNKGFKSSGVVAVARRLDQNLPAGRQGTDDITLGISIGSSNIPEVDTISKAIDDYLFSLDYLKAKKYIKYFELNISCPNTAMPESFTSPKNLKSLLSKIECKKPLFIKMPNELPIEKIYELVKLSLKFPITGFIFSNLVKDRKNKHLHSQEIKKWEGFKGNFSGKPTAENANRLIACVSKKYGKDCKIIGCGGVFNAQDAYEKIQAGANLIQMITGLVFEGPQVVGEINRGLVKNFGLNYN